MLVPDTGEQDLLGKGPVVKAWPPVLRRGGSVGVHVAARAASPEVGHVSQSEKHDQNFPHLSFACSALKGSGVPEWNDEDSVQETG